MDEELERAARAMKPQGGRPFVTAVVLNSLLALLLLGIPYMRGRSRAAEAVGRYAQFAACIFDADVAAEPGLGMPPGYEDRYAERFARAPLDWPSRCDVALDALAPDEVVFIMPGSKNAEATLRAAIELTHSELGAMARARGDAAPSVPERPLLALDRLRGAVAEVLMASGLEVDDTPAITLRAGAPASPSRVPLGTGTGGPFAARPEPGGIRALGADGRRVACVASQEGRVREYHARRPPSARGALLAALGPFLVTTTSEASCEEDELRCARRLTGITRFGEEDASGDLTPRYWLGGHPASRIDRAIFLDAATARIAARASDGRGVDLRHFEMPSDDAPTAQVSDAGVAEPLHSAAELEIGIVRDVLVFDRGARWVFVRDSLTYLAMASAAGEPLAQVQIDDLGQHLSVWACGQWSVAAGSEGFVAMTPEGIALPRVDRALRTPLVGPSAEEDGLALACAGEALDVFVLTRSGALDHVRCDEQGCAPPRELATRAVSVSAAHARATSLVAYHGGGAAPQIYTRSVTADSLGPVDAPSPCWERGAGLCGAPTVVSDGETILLIAHERGDLLVMAWRDEGWSSLPGLP